MDTFWKCFGDQLTIDNWPSSIRIRNRKRDIFKYVEVTSKASKSMTETNKKSMVKRRRFDKHKKTSHENYSPEWNHRHPNKFIRVLYILHYYLHIHHQSLFTGYRKRVRKKVKKTSTRIRQHMQYCSIATTPSAEIWNFVSFQSSSQQSTGSTNRGSHHTYGHRKCTRKKWIVQSNTKKKLNKDPPRKNINAIGPRQQHHWNRKRTKVEISNRDNLRIMNHSK